MTTQFENLPDDLIEQIFLYLSVVDSFEKFSSLNRRFEKILRSMRNLSVSTEFNVDSMKILQFFADRITKLRIRTFSPIDFSFLPNLKFLQIEAPFVEILDDVRADFNPKLEVLRLSTPFHRVLTEKTLNKFFSNKFSFLKNLEFRLVENFPRSIKFLPVSVRFLTLTSIEPDLFYRILRFFPNLFSLKIKFYASKTNFRSNSVAPLNHPLKVFFLDDFYGKIQTEILLDIFLAAKNLEKLALCCVCQISFFHFLQSTHRILTNLKQFRCDVTQIPPNSSTDIEQIRSLNPIFSSIQCDQIDSRFQRFFTD